MCMKRIWYKEDTNCIIRSLCLDINECGVDNGGCSEVCENTDGSFFCACDGDEKALSSDGKSCVGTYTGAL